MSVNRAQFMQLRGCSGKVKTFALQSQLPRLPVPNLEESVNVYLQTIRPLANPDQFENTKQRAQEFLENQGPVLQQRLLEHAEQKNKIGESWLERWWYDLAYLSFRLPLPTNSNYYLLFDTMTQAPQIPRAAKLIVGALDYRERILREEIPVQYLRKTSPQCMAQYNQIFTVSRIGKPDVDVLKPITNSRHIVVLANGQIYKLVVLNEQGVPYREADIAAQLEQIQRQAEQNPPENVAAITAIHRDNSTRVRALLEKNNAAALDDIDNALFSLSLDPDQPTTPSEAGELLNGGNKNTARDRWFEKVINFVVFKNGLSGLSGEHAPLDAPMVGNVADYIVNSINSNKLSPGVAGIPQYQKLNWNLTDDVALELTKSEKEAAHVLLNLETQVFQFHDYGANWIKSVAGASPDAYVQMSIQLAYYYLHRESAATYETGTARAFFHGRTDTCRTLSVDSQAWTHAMGNKNVSREERRAKLQKALESHVAYMQRATQGKAIDRHFLGLRQVRKSDEPVPGIFSDPIWAESVRFRISTSNMTGDHFLCGFGPTEPDGYGVCYGTRENELHYSVSTFRTCPKTNATAFVASLRQALTNMRSLFNEPSKL